MNQAEKNYAACVIDKLSDKELSDEFRTKLMWDIANDVMCNCKLLHLRDNGNSYTILVEEYLVKHQCGKTFEECGETRAHQTGLGRRYVYVTAEYTGRQDRAWQEIQDGIKKFGFGPEDVDLSVFRNDVKAPKWARKLIWQEANQIAEEFNLPQVKDDYGLGVTVNAISQMYKDIDDNLTSIYTDKGHTIMDLLLADRKVSSRTIDALGVLVSAIKEDCEEAKAAKEKGQL